MSWLSDALEQIGGVLDAPRHALFSALGGDGSGAGLLNSAFGVDPESGLGRYGGLAAEVLLDPLNLVGGAAVRGAARGLDALGAARKASQVGGIGRDLNAARSLDEAADLARGTVSMNAGPGGLPLDSPAFGQLRPEVVTSAGRKEKGAVQAGLGGEMYPTFARGRDAANFNDNTRRQLSSGLGDLYDAELLPDFRSGVLRNNAASNAALRESEFAASGLDPSGMSIWEALGPQAGEVAERAAGNPLLAALLRARGATPSTLDAKPAIERLLAQLAEAQAAQAPQYGQYAIAAGGGLLGGRAGAQALGGGQ